MDLQLTGRQAHRNVRTGAIVLGLMVGAAGAMARRYSTHGTAADLNWAERLKQEHREVEALLEQLDQTEPDERERLVQRIAKMLTRHVHDEEYVIYPEIAAQLGRDQAMPLYADHANIKLALRSLIDCPQDDPEFRSLAAALRRLLVDHIAQEEIIIAELKGLPDPAANDAITAKLLKDRSLR